jgi:hypothetical protein
MNIIEAFPIPAVVERVARAMWEQRCAHTMRTAGIKLEGWGEDGVVPLANGIIEEAIAAIKAMGDFDTSDFTFTEAEAIRRLFDEALK